MTSPLFPVDRSDSLTPSKDSHSWPTFWRMTLFALSNLEQPLSVLGERASTSRWPLVPPEARPPTEFVLQQVSSLGKVLVRSGV